MMFLEKGHQKQRKHIYFRKKNFRKSSIWFPEFGTQRNGKGQKLANGHALEEEKQTSPFPNDCTGRFFADQFENLANFRAHYDRTGPEIWKQTDGSLHAFVAAAGTRGTMAGVSFFLKLQMMIRRKRIWIIQMMIMMIRYVNPFFLHFLNFVNFNSYKGNFMLLAYTHFVLACSKSCFGAWCLSLEGGATQEMEGFQAQIL
ncbi:hypothetical protein Droror1_Dr00006457 [Drosera rotundifolia]